MHGLISVDCMWIICLYCVHEKCMGQTLYKYWMVVRGQHCTTEELGIIVQCWSTLAVDICFVISRNNCNKFVSTSVTQQHRIRIDLPNTLGSKIDANAWCNVVYTMLPGNMDHVMPCSPGTWCCTDETGQHCLFLHIMWRALDKSRSRNSDHDITKLLDPYSKKSGSVEPRWLAYIRSLIQCITSLSLPANTVLSVAGRRGVHYEWQY